MRIRISKLLLLLLLPVLSFSQKEHDNTIKVKGVNSTSKVFGILNEMGYFFHYDSASGVLNTKPNKINDSLTIRLQIIVDTKYIIITGMVRNTDTASLLLNNLKTKEWYNIIEFKKEDSSVMHYAFGQLQLIALKINGHIKYLHTFSHFGG